MLEYRPVECESGALTPPGYVNRDAIYKGGAQEGWGWFVYKGSYFKHAEPGGWAGGWGGAARGGGGARGGCVAARPAWHAAPALSRGARPWPRGP
jgi:hypothetical protein